MACRPLVVIQLTPFRMRTLFVIIHSYCLFPLHMSKLEALGFFGANPNFRPFFRPKILIVDFRPFSGVGVKDGQ